MSDATSTSTAATASAGTESTSAAAEASTATSTAASTGQASTDQSTETSTDPWADPDAARTEIERLRRENAASRTNAKTQAAQEARDAVLQEFGKALGFIKDGEGTPTAEQLTDQLGSTTDELRLTKVELAVYRAAGTHQGDPAALLDSRTFLAKVADLDPAAADFQTQIGDAIKKAVAENTKLRVAPEATRSSVSHAGGTGEGAVSAEHFAAMTPAEKNQLFVTNPDLYRQLTGR